MFRKQAAMETGKGRFRQGIFARPLKRCGQQTSCVSRLYARCNVRLSEVRDEMIFWRVNPLAEGTLAGLHTGCVALAEGGRTGLEAHAGAPALFTD